MGTNSRQAKGTPVYRKKHFQSIWSEQTSTNSYVDLGIAWDKTGFQIGTLQIKNTGDTNEIDYKLLGSLDGTTYDIEIVSETTLAVESNDLIDIGYLSEGSYIPYVKFQIKSTVSDSHSTVEAIGVCI